jgi:hypothetical protein
MALNPPLRGFIKNPLTQNPVVQPHVSISHTSHTLPRVKPKPSTLSTQDETRKLTNLLSSYSHHSLQVTATVSSLPFPLSLVFCLRTVTANTASPTRQVYALIYLVSVPLFRTGNYFYFALGILCRGSHCTTLTSPKGL